MRARHRGDKTWYYFDTGSKPRKEIPLGANYADALRKMSQLLSIEGLEPPKTFAAIVSHYLESDEFADLSCGTRADYKAAIDMLMKLFWDAPLDEVTPVDVKHYLAYRCKTSTHRAYREVTMFGMLFRYARSENWTINKPTEPIRLPKLPGRKHVYVSDEWYDAVYDMATEALRDAMDLAYYLGQRPGDLLSITEDHIVDGCIELRQQKTGMPQRFVIQGPLEELIARIRARKDSFPQVCQHLLVDERGMRLTKAKLRHRFEQAREEAGIAGTDFQFRDLRRKSGSDVRDQSGSLDAAQALLGHMSQEMTEHYTAARGKVVDILPKARKVAGRKI